MNLLTKDSSMPRTYTNNSSPSVLMMSPSDRAQFRRYTKEVLKVESEAYTAEKAVQYAKEDAEINDINYHLTSLEV